MHKAAFIYSDDLLGYGFDETHPLKPKRMRMTYDLLSAYGVFKQPDVMLRAPLPASRDDILLAHDNDYVNVVEKLSHGDMVYNAYMYGFRSPDNPAFEGMYEASLLYTGASVQAAEMVMSGEADVAFSVSGGLHHAKHGQASGFCVFNDPVVALHHMLRKWEKIAYVDIDAHHGDGVQEAFYNSHRVLTCSIHQSGRWLFPGTGFVEEIGKDDGKGYSLNAPLAPFTDDYTLYRVFEQGVLPVLQAFQPQALLLQLGVDGHFEDPLTKLSYTTDGWMRVVQALLDLGLPTVAVGGGGYNIYTVCRMWSLAYAAMCGIDLPQETPDEFRERYGIYFLRDIFHPEHTDSQERTVAETAQDTLDKIQRLIFPLHGIPVSGQVTSDQ